MSVFFTILFWLAAYLAVGILAVAIRKVFERIEGITPEFAAWYWDFVRHHNPRSVHSWYHDGYKGAVAPEPRPDPADLKAKKFKSLNVNYGTSLLAFCWPGHLVFALFWLTVKYLYRVYPEQIAQKILKGMK